MTRDGEELRFDWRRGGAAAAGLFAALVLVVMVILVKFANDAREHALSAERHSYDVALVVRNVSSNMSRAEAALARFVLDEDQQTSGAIYSSDWGLAGYQIQQLEKLMRGNPDQARRVAELEQLYQKRDGELAMAARAAIARQDQSGISYFYQAGQSGTGTKVDDKLNEIIASERLSLRAKIEQSQLFSAQADRFTDYLSWLGVLVGVGAVFLGVVANQALKAEAAEREAAEAQLRQVQKMEAVGQLTGGIAHDFNNMLAVVVGGIDLALRRLNGPRREIMTHLNNAMEGATRAAALTRRLLSFARSEPLLPERVDSTDLIGGMSDLLDRTLGERIRIEVDLNRDAWPIY